MFKKIFKDAALLGFLFLSNDMECLEFFLRKKLDYMESGLIGIALNGI